MSQSGKLVNNQPVPGAGIQTVTGNAGGAVPGDGAANLNLVGAGTITVTGVQAANTLTISSTGVPATYTTNDGNAVAPDGAGNVNIYGSTNIETTGATAHTVNIVLKDDITLAGTCQADNLIADNDITATAGDIAALAGNITAAGIVAGVGGASFDGQVTINANGLNSTGATVLNDLNRGVVQTDAAHTLFSDNGAAGAVLIGGGVAPTWNTLTAGTDIAITNGNNAITIAAGTHLADSYVTDAGNAIPNANVLYAVGGTNINTAGAGSVLTVNLDNNVALPGTLSVTGTSTLTGATACGSTLIVAGATQLNNNLVVAGAETVTGNTVLNGTATCNSTLTVANTAQFNSNVNIPAGNLYVTSAASQIYAANIHATSNITLDNTGALYLAENQSGVLVTDAAGLVTASQGTDGKLLIGETNNAPSWANLTSAGGSITITNAAHSINLEATANTFCGFKAGLSSGIPCGTRFTDPSTYYAGTLQAMTALYNVGNAFYVGDGAASPATFTAPTSGYYSFTFKICYGNSSAAQDKPLGGYSWNLFLYKVGGSSQSVFQHYCPPGPYNSAGLNAVSYINSVETTEELYLAAGDVIEFGFRTQANLTSTTSYLQIGPNYNNKGEFSISGYRIGT
jgi:hypothetical protein